MKWCNNSEIWFCVRHYQIDIFRNESSVVLFALQSCVTRIPPFCMHVTVPCSAYVDDHQVRHLPRSEKQGFLLRRMDGQ